MVVALTILAILLSLAFPAMKALSEDGEDGHVTALKELSSALRLRAMSEQRPYQIVFDQQAIYGLRYYYPYQEETPFREFLLKLEEERLRRKEEIKREEVQRLQMAQEQLADEAASSAEGQGTPALPAKPDIDAEYFVRSIALPEGTRVEVRPWGEVEWALVDGTKIHRWVFQPSGLCDPLQVRLGVKDQWHELSFELLTGELGAQRFYRQ